jgi:hypothetical protein
LGQDLEALVRRVCAWVVDVVLFWIWISAAAADEAFAVLLGPLVTKFLFQWTIMESVNPDARVP